MSTSMQADTCDGRENLLQTLHHVKQTEILNSLVTSKEQPQVSYTIGPGECELGEGGYSRVYEAVDANTGQVVALKKSRASLRVKRPHLRYESWVLHLLQGHSGIPKLYGYGHLEHFEYISMELLGRSVRDKLTGKGTGLPVITVVRVLEQALSAINHVHKHGLVHRDIKPENLLCSNSDSSKIVLIDFGLTKRTAFGPPKIYDPLKEKKSIVGTLHWASLNSHRGIDLAPRDDLESFAYTVLFLLRGNMPWLKKRKLKEPTLRTQAQVYRSKSSFSGSQLALHFPADFAYLLDYSRNLGYHQLPDYDDLENRFSLLADSLGGYTKADPLDWTQVSVPVPAIKTDQHPIKSNEGEDADYEPNDDDSVTYTNSYINGWDIDQWDDRHGSRTASLTLPIQIEDSADSKIPIITRVIMRPIVA